MASAKPCATTTRPGPDRPADLLAPGQEADHGGPADVPRGGFRYRRATARGRWTPSWPSAFAGPRWAPVALDLPDGRHVHFRGLADRVDVADDGTLHVVDYKTGKADNYRDLSEDNPDAQGTAAAAGRLRPGGPPAATGPLTRRCGPSTGSSRPGAASNVLATRSPPTCWSTSARPSAADGGRHRSGSLPPLPDGNEHDALGGVPLLRSRRHGGGRAPPSVRAQAGRSGHGRLCASCPIPLEEIDVDTETEQLLPDGLSRSAVAPGPPPARPVGPRNGSASDLDTTLFVEAGAGSGRHRPWSTGPGAGDWAVTSSSGASPPSPSPRRREPSCATAFAPNWRRRPKATPTVTRGRAAG